MTSSLSVVSELEESTREGPQPQGADMPAGPRDRHHKAVAHALVSVGAVGAHGRMLNSALGGQGWLPGEVNLHSNSK